ncbi:hypothetical protein J0910_23265 [Nocardiopsis sp. CNT-189]
MPSRLERAFRRSRRTLKLPELRHSSVSLLSDDGMPLDEIALLVGQSGTQVAEEVDRKRIRPVIQIGTAAMDRIFSRADQGR